MQWTWQPFKNNTLVIDQLKDYMKSSLMGANYI